jgi:hypothetical protein
MRSFTFRADTNQNVYWDALREVSDADIVILSFFVQRTRYTNAAPIGEWDRDFIEEVIETRPGQVVAMSYGNPHLIRKIPAVPTFLVGYGERGWYGNQAVYFDSFIRALKGELEPAGRLPVRVSVEYPIGSGLGYPTLSGGTPSAGRPGRGSDHP